MDTQTVTPSTGHVRLSLTLPSGRTALVGPFGSLSGARQLATDLIDAKAVQAVRVEHRNRGTWRPAWSFAAGLSLLLVTVSGCACLTKATLTPEEYSACSVYAGALAGGAAYMPPPVPPPVTIRCHRNGPDVVCEASR